jgi:hypothetical protein
MQEQDMSRFPNVSRFIATMEARPDVARALAKAGEFDWSAGWTDAELQARIEKVDA